MKTKVKLVKDYLVGKSEEDILNDIKCLSQKQLDDTLFRVVERDNDDTLIIVKALLKAGANVNTRNFGNWTPLMIAAGFGKINLIELLLDNGANIEAGDIAGWTPLIWAVRYGNGNVVKLLLDRGANINAEDDRGKTSLNMALHYSKISVYNLLKSYGAK